MPLDASIFSDQLSHIVSFVKFSKLAFLEIILTGNNSEYCRQNLITLYYSNFVHVFFRLTRLQI